MSEMRRRTLTKMEELLADPKNWTRGAYSRDSDGNAVSANSPSAVSWCLGGAYLKATGSHSDPVIWKALSDALPWYARGSVGNFNDRPDTTHEMVLAIIAKAKESL